MKTRTKRLALTLGMACVLHAFALPTHAREAYQMVITIYNKTPVKLTYQLRVNQEGYPGRKGGWTEWKEYTHKHPHGYQYHTFEQVDDIQIRFDRIGGDGKFTEQVYDLDFNAVRADKRIGRKDGRPYKLEFDAGGRLLDLYTHEHGWCCW